MRGRIRNRLQSVEHWELLALMLLTSTAIVTLYMIGLLIVRPFVPIANSGLYVLAGVGVALLILWVQYWRDMRRQRQRGTELTPEQAPELHRAAERLSTEMGIEKPELRILDREIPNALAVGRRSDGIVFFHTGLLEVMDRDETEAILAHELAHLKNRDSLVMQMAEIVRRMLRRGAWACAWFVVLIASIIAAAVDENQTKRQREKMARRQAMIVAAITGFVSGLVLVFSRTLSRNREYIADLTAAEATNKPAAMQSALRSLDDATSGGEAVPNDGAAALYILNDVGARFGRLFDTHPSIEKRIEVLESDYGTDDEPTRAYDEGATLGSFTKFGLTGAPTLIVASGVGYGVFTLLELIGVAGSGGSGSAWSGLLAVLIALSLLASFVAFPWAMLFGDGGTPALGFAAVALLLVFFFGGSLVEGLSIGAYVMALAYAGLVAVAALHLRDVIADWRATA